MPKTSIQNSHSPSSCVSRLLMSPQPRLRRVATAGAPHRHSLLLIVRSSNPHTLRPLSWRHRLVRDVRHLGAAKAGCASNVRLGGKGGADLSVCPLMTQSGRFQRSMGRSPISPPKGTSLAVTCLSNSSPTEVKGRLYAAIVARTVQCLLEESRCYGAGDAVVAVNHGNGDQGAKSLKQNRHPFNRA